MKAALYIRVSTTYQIDKDSLPVQRQDLINYAKYAFNIDDYEIFEDAGFSGKNTNRPAFQEMMERIRNKEFSHLFVWKIDRVSRNLLDFCDMYEELKKYDCTFISKNEQFDTSSAMGEAMLKIILVFAELERKLTSERVTSIMLARAEKGLWNGANVPLGYSYDEETKYPIINENEAKTIRFIFDMYEKRQSTAAISKYLNENNVHTKRGGSWTSKGIGDIIHNPFYYGTLRYNYRESARGKKKSEGEWIVKENNHEGIISKEQWLRCNKIIEENAKKNASRFRSMNQIQHIFGGLIYCKTCGAKYICSLDKPRKDGYKPSRYICGGKIKGVICDNKIVTDVTIGDFMLQYVLNFISCINKIPSNLEDLENRLLGNSDVCLDYDSLYDTFSMLAYINQMRKNNYKYEDLDKIVDFEKVKSNKSEIDSLLENKSKLERAAERLTNLYLYDDVPMSEREFYKRKTEIEDKLSEVNEKLNALNNEKNKPKITDLGFMDEMDDLLLRLDFTGSSLRELTMNNDRKILKDFFETIIEKIIVCDKRVDSIVFRNGLVHKFYYK